MSPFRGKFIREILFQLISISSVINSIVTEVRLCLKSDFVCSMLTEKSACLPVQYLHPFFPFCLLMKKKVFTEIITVIPNKPFLVNVTATPSLSREAQVCVLSTLGALLFHWLAAFQVDTFLCEGVIYV